MGMAAFKKNHFYGNLLEQGFFQNRKFPFFFFFPKDTRGSEEDEECGKLLNEFILRSVYLTAVRI